MNSIMNMNLISFKSFQLIQVKPIIVKFKIKFKIYECQCSVLSNSSGHRPCSRFIGHGRLNRAGRTHIMFIV